MSAILLLHASREGQTERIAQRIAASLAARGHRVEVTPAAQQVDLSGFDAIMVGASVHYGRHPASLAALLRRNAALLAGRSSAFFSVSLGAKTEYATHFLHETRWKPALVAVFAGALRYSAYGPLKRLLVRAFAAAAGHDTDSSKDYDYTDWKAVDEFATAFAERLTSAS